jgi:hypothetical protein
MIYLVAYDLREPNSPADYAKIIDAIKAYATWMRVEQSVWLIESAQSYTQIRDNLMQYVRSDDTLLVGRLLNAAWSNTLSEDRISWLKGRSSW